MKNNTFQTLFFCLSFLFTVHLNAQSEIEIKDFYEAEAYHLTIKKINELNAKEKSNPALQFVLADCYWNIGYHLQSAQVYKEVARETAIPLAFQEKYQTAISYKPVGDKTESTTHDTHFSNNDLTTSSKQVDIEAEKALYLEVAARKKKHNNELTSENPASKNNGLIENSTASVSFIPLTIEPSNSKVQPSVYEVFSANDSKTSGDYRIRISINTKDETDDLKSLQKLKNVSSSKWEGKKIILAGYFDTITEAEDIIESYLEEAYENISIVTKKGNRYKSVGKSLVAK